MKYISPLSLLLSLALLFGATAHAAEYNVDPSHSHIGFTVSHMVSKVKGQFKDFSGSFSFDPKTASEATGKFVAKTDSISTDNEKRDAHLKSPDFFDAKKFPEVTLTNVKISPAGDNKYKMTGDLTLHGVTKPQTFDLEYNGTAKDPWGGTRAGFSAMGKLNRQDFGLNWNKALDNGGLLVGNEVAIELQVEAVEGKPADAKAEEKKADKKQSKKTGNKKTDAHSKSE
jgi:polyisoprenoid-binding protein YceI